MHRIVYKHLYIWNTCIVHCAYSYIRLNWISCLLVSIPVERIWTKRGKMIVTLRTKVFLQNLIGDGDMLPRLPMMFWNAWLRERFIVPFVITFSMFSIQLGNSIDFVLNVRDDLVHACALLISALGFSIWIVIYLHFLFNRQRFYSLFNEVEDIVYESELNYSFHEKVLNYKRIFSIPFWSNIKFESCQTD